jgi:hypothetical protein
MARGVDSEAVKQIKQFEAEVHEVVRKALPKIIGEAIAHGLVDPKKQRLQKQRFSDGSHRTIVVSDYRGIHPLAHEVKRRGSKAAAAKALGMAESTFRDRLKLEAARG